MLLVKTILLLLAQLTLGCWLQETCRNLLHADIDRYKFLTTAYQGSDFATQYVTKKGKGIPPKFRASWLNEFEWLCYSPSKGRAYCKYCILFAKEQPRKALGYLVKTPFIKFSKAKGKDGHLTTHDVSDYHHDAMVIGKAFVENFKNSEMRSDSCIQQHKKEVSDQNIHILTIIVGVTLGNARATSERTQG